MSPELAEEKGIKNGEVIIVESIRGKVEAVAMVTVRMRHGFGQWFMGTSLLYMLASVLFRLSRPPIVVGGLAMGWGYLRAMLLRKPRYEGPAFRTILRKYQFDCLRLGKAKATQQLNEAQAEHWRVPPPPTPTQPLQSVAARQADPTPQGTTQ